MTTPRRLTRPELETAVMDKLRSRPSWRSCDEDVFQQVVSQKTTAELESLLAREDARANGKEAK
jgi:hypothetical protein